MEFLLRLLKISVIAGAVTALLCLLGPVLRRRYHAKWRYWVWLCLALLLLSPLVPLPELEGRTVYRAPVRVEVPAMAVEYDRGAGLSLAPQDTTLEALPPVTETTPAAKMPAAAPQAETVRKIPVETILLALWGLGTAGCLLWTVLTTVLFSRRCLRWARVPDSETAAALAAEREALGVSGPVACTSPPAPPAPRPWDCCEGKSSYPRDRGSRSSCGLCCAMSWCT